MRQPVLSAKALFALLLTLLLAACPRSDQNQAGQQAREGGKGPTVELPSFVTLVKKEGSAVVNISTTRTLRRGGEMAPGIPGDDPFFEFFRRFMPPPGPQEFQARSLGSGFLISPDGYILTNAHVVADTDEVIVRLTTKREFKARVVGADVRTDVALIKIDAKDLPAVRIGDPASLEVGEWVAAIGAPFGFENSVTAGIVSAKGRSLSEESYVPFIQTDVALNPGNSGGPLFNMRGEVVGVNSQIVSQTGGYMGLSFTIPIDIAMDIVKQLRASGKVTRGRLGVQAQDLSAELAASFGLKEISGALVTMTEKGGPADSAGIMPGDVVLSFNGKPVHNSADLARQVASVIPGATVNLDVWRKGVRQTVEARVGELAPERGAAALAEQAPANPAGLALEALTPEQRGRLKTESGLLVRNATGAAQRAGIQPGDVVLAINDVPAKSVAEFEAILAQNAGKTIALLIRRGPETLFLPLRLQ
ncbi:MAG: DegQ family serine endoprotease [Pseudomonadota bacterium]